MRLKLTHAIILLLTSASCAEHHAFSETELERKRMEVSDRVTLHDLITNPDFDNSDETMLHNAAFEMVKGMSAEQAIATFANDGATCEGSTCIWAEREREPLGVLIYPGIRAPGPRRTFDHFRQVTIRSAVVTVPGDIVVRSWSKRVDETE